MEGLVAVLETGESLSRMVLETGESLSHVTLSALLLTK